MKPRSVLFICVHNTARSQMAQAYCNELGQGRFAAESAGLMPGTLLQDAVLVMGEEGLDISRNPTRSVFDLYRQGRLFDIIVTVCDDATERECPVFPGIAQRLHWPFPDPAAVGGGPDERLAKVRAIRDQIKAKIRDFVAAP